MIKNLKQLIFVLLVYFPITALSADLGLIDGMWQDDSRQTDYYSIFQDGNTIVVIDLSRLESGRSTLAATYVGPINDALLTPLAAFPEFPFDQTPRSLTFTSDTEATLKFEGDCDVCSLVAVPLKKVFK